MIANEMYFLSHTQCSAYFPFSLIATQTFIHMKLSAICRAVRPPPQNSAKAKKLGGDQLPVKARLVQLIISGGGTKPPTD